MTKAEAVRRPKLAPAAGPIQQVAPFARRRRLRTAKCVGRRGRNKIVCFSSSIIVNDGGGSVRQIPLVALMVVMVKGAGASAEERAPSARSKTPLTAKAADDNKVIIVLLTTAIVTVMCCC